MSSANLPQLAVHRRASQNFQCRKKDPDWENKADKIPFLHARQREKEKEPAGERETYSQIPAL